MRSSTKIAALTIAAFATTSVRAFVAPSSSSSSSTTSTSTSPLSLVSSSSSFFASSSSSASSISLRAAAKGFGAPPPEPRKKSSGEIDRENKASKYDEIARSGGGQEYRVFVRQFGSDDRSWLPVGSVAVPRGAQVTDAIFANETGLRKSIVRTYDKLKGMEMEFEYGYNLKIYPDDPIQVAMKGQGGGGGGASSGGPSLGNWISNLLSPVDASGVAMPPPPKED